jgi:hypothetical protein
LLETDELLADVNLHFPESYGLIALELLFASQLLLPLEPFSLSPSLSLDPLDLSLVLFGGPPPPFKLPVKVVSLELILNPGR